MFKIKVIKWSFLVSSLYLLWLPITAQILEPQFDSDTFFVAERPFGGGGIGYWSNDSNRGFVAANGKDGFAADSNTDDGFVAIANGGDGLFAASNEGYAAYLVSPITRTDPAIYMRHFNENSFDLHIGGDARIKADDSYVIYLNQDGSTGGGESFQIRNSSGSFASAPFVVYESGEATFSGNVCAANISCSSDHRYKENITSLSNNLNNLALINGVYYDWDKEKWPDRNFSDDRQIGFIAQELEEVYPELVHTDADGYKSVVYNKMTAVLVEAVKELDVENQELKLLIREIETRLAKLENAK